MQMINKFYVYCIKCSARFESEYKHECPNCGCKQEGAVIDITDLNDNEDEKAEVLAA
jgi:rRNA maturation endonuclease Nob1